MYFLPYRNLTVKPVQQQGLAAIAAYNTEQRCIKGAGSDLGILYVSQAAIVRKQQRGLPSLVSAKHRQITECQINELTVHGNYAKVNYSHEPCLC